MPSIAAGRDARAARHEVGKALSHEQREEADEELVDDRRGRRLTPVPLTGAPSLRGARLLSARELEPRGRQAGRLALRGEHACVSREHEARGTHPLGEREASRRGSGLGHARNARRRLGCCVARRLGRRPSRRLGRRPSRRLGRHLGRRPGRHHFQRRRRLARLA